MCVCMFFFFKQKTAYEMRISDWSSDVCSSDLGSWWMRWLTRLGGVQDPHGSMPRDMRRTFVRQRPQLKAAVERMLAWEPERIVLAPGRWYEHDGAAEPRRAFGCLPAFIGAAHPTAIALRPVPHPTTTPPHPNQGQLPPHAHPATPPTEK